MADTKTTALTENTTPATTDIMMIVDDPGGSAASQKITLANLRTVVTSKVLISEQTPTGTGTVTWSSIPATYKSLEIEYVARGTQAATSVNISLYFNNDTTATNYQRFITGGSGTSTAVNAGADDAVIGSIAGASATAGCAGHAAIKVINYAGTTFWKSALVHINVVTAATVAATRYSTNLTWENTGAINRVDLVLALGNYDTGSTFRLYGVL